MCRVESHQAKLIRRGLKRQLSESAHPAADRASLLADANVAADSVPTLPEVYKHATYKRHRPGGETLTYEDLEAYVRANMRTPDCRDVQLWFVGPSISPQIVLPFSSDFLLSQVEGFLSRTTVVRLVLDFTHDMCSQRYKVGVVAALGVHYNNYEWHSTIIPICFCISATENFDAYSKLIRTWRIWGVTRRACADVSAKEPSKADTKSKHADNLAPT